MLQSQTSDKLKHLKLYGMGKELENQRNNPDLQALSFNERFGMLVDREVCERDTRGLERRVRAAKFKVSACVEDIKYSKARGLDRQVINNLTTCDWIAKHQNVLITGSTGVGKTWIACALGQQACRQGYSAIFMRLSRLIEELEIAYGDGSLPKLRQKMAKTNLLVLDDWALSPITKRGRHELLEIIDDRINSGSMIISSQLPVEQWHEYLGDPTLADAILDRLVHRAHKIELHGESMRKQDAKGVINNG